MKHRRSHAQPATVLPPILAVGGVVYRITEHATLEILLLRKQGGFWTLPKGQIERGESHVDAAKREVREETGITAEIGPRICAVSYTVLKQNRPRTKIVTYYLMSAQAGKLRPSKAEHIAQLKWFPCSEALRRIKRPRVREIAMQGLALLQSAQ